MLRRKNDILQVVLCIALLFVIPLILAIPAVYTGALPIDLDALTTRTPWQEARPDGAATPKEEDSAPIIERYYPWYAFINECGTKGELPLWNPYESFGTPFLALWRTRALSPFSLPIYFLPLCKGIGISIFFKILIAGLCAYYAARRFHFAPAFALLPALTFQMSGILLVGHWHPASDVLPWFPLLLPPLQRLLLGQYRIWPSVSILIGIMALGGDPETIVVVILFLYLLTFTYGIRTYTAMHLTGALLTLTLAVSAGISLIAIQAAPYIEFLSQGKLADIKAAATGIAGFSMILAPVPSASTITLASLLPAGVIGLLLLPLWLAVRQRASRLRKRRLESFLLATFFLFILSAFAPLLRQISAVSHFSVWHFAISLPLASAFLAAAAAEEWVHLDAEQCKQAIAKLVWLIPPCWGLIFLITFIAMSASLDTTKILVSCAVAIFILMLLVTTALWPKEKLLIFSLIFLTATTSWLIYAPSQHSSKSCEVFPETHFIKTLHKIGSRTAGSIRLREWPLSPHQIAQTYSPSGILLDRCCEFMRQAEEHPQLLRLTGAEALLLTKQDIKERYASLRPALNIQEVFPSGAILLKDLQTKERVYVAHTGRTFDKDKPQPLRVSGPPLLEGGVLPETLNDSATSTATIVHDTLNDIEIEATSSRPGILVLNDSWYPGWIATVDGNISPIFPVDIAFRGVEMSEGTHTIRFRYAPPSIKLGMYWSLVTFCFVLFFNFLHYRHRQSR